MYKLQLYIFPFFLKQVLRIFDYVSKDKKSGNTLTAINNSRILLEISKQIMTTHFSIRHITHMYSHINEYNHFSCEYFSKKNVL